MGTPLLLGAGSFGVSYDADAQAYFNANTLITSTADKNAINTFYLGLKSDGIYTKIKAMYLPIWGSAASCKWNLVNPVDTNAAFRLTFATGFTFSSGGMTPNGTSAYADTFLIPSSNLSQNNNHISYYSRTNVNTTQVEIGATTSGNPPSSILEIRTSGVTYLNLSSNAYVTYTDANSQGFYIGSRTASNVIKLYKNNSNVASGTTASTGQSNNALSLCAQNNGTTRLYYSTKQCAFASIGEGLDNTEAANFYTRVNTLMTYFGINV